MLQKIFTHHGVGDAVENIHTQWGRGCCRKYLHKIFMEQRMLYKIFTYNREGDAVQLFKHYGAGDAVQNIHTQQSMECCTKYSHTIGAGDPVENIDTKGSRGCCRKYSHNME
jgi:hypothetical protein